MDRGATHRPDVGQNFSKKDPLHVILSQLPTAVFVLDRDGHPFYANHAALELLGKGINPSNGSSNLAVTYQAFVANRDEVYPTQRMPIVRALRGETSTVDDMVIRRPDGDMEIEVWGAPIFDQSGAVEYAVATFENISQRRQLERQIGLDPLTGLGNRYALRNDLDRAVSRLDRTRKGLAVLFVDLNGFKAINDRFGHLEGDQVLVRMGQRIMKASRQSERPYRVGGDEFVVICDDLSNTEDAEKVADRLNREIGRPLKMQDRTVQLTASIGIATTQTGEFSSDQLIMLADSDMYERKRGSSGNGARI